MKAEDNLFQREAEKFAALDLPWEKLRGKAIAITGATGLIGGSLLRYLRAANEIRALDLRLIPLCRKPDRLPGAVFYDALGELPEFEADYIIHAASNAHPLAFSSDPVGTMQANLLGTMRLLERIRERGGRLVFCSTGEIYGENPALDSFDEAAFGAIDPMRARSCYPESKRAGETLCAAYHAQYGVDALAARLCYVYGPGITPENSRADAQFLRKARSGEDIVLKSPGSQVRSYCYVFDAASALLTLMLRGEAGQAYNVSGSTASIREYAETLAALAGVSLRFELPPDAEKQGYSAVTRAVLDSGKLQALGWKAEYGLEEGLKRTLG